MRPVAKAQIYSVKTKTHQQTKSHECEAYLINLKELVEKRKEKAKSPKKLQRNCKLLLYWMYIKFFRSLTTDIYSLALPSPSRLRQTLLDYKEKDLLKINYFKYYNRIVKIFLESGSSSPSLTSSTTLHRPSTRSSGSASSKHIPLVHRTDLIGRFQPCSSFGFFQIGHFRFTKITFLDTCQKMVSTHAPQF